MTTTTAEPTRTEADAVMSFLKAIEAGDHGTVEALLADDAVWINVTLPTVRGRGRILRVLRLMPRTKTRFRVHFHNIAAEGNVVLTERTDALGRGRFEQRFWVYGRFELEDGRIKVWRDSFDWVDILVSLVRALGGVAFPRLNRRWPE